MTTLKDRINQHLSRIPESFEKESIRRIKEDVKEAVFKFELELYNKFNHSGIEGYELLESIERLHKKILGDFEK